MNQLIRTKFCKVCGNVTRARGLCENHYRQALNKGVFNTGVSPIEQTILRDLEGFPKSTIYEICDRTNLSIDSTRIYLTRLRHKGLVLREGVALRSQPHFWSKADG